MLCKDTNFSTINKIFREKVLAGASKKLSYPQIISCRQDNARRKATDFSTASMPFLFRSNYAICLLFSIFALRIEVNSISENPFSSTRIFLCGEQMKQTSVNVYEYADLNPKYKIP